MLEAMAPRAMASGTVCLGLVTVPVRVYAAAESAGGVSFNLLHAGCGSRVKQQYVCAKDGSVVERAAMVKGHEFAKDQYVTFTEDEIKALAEASTTAIDIVEFVPLAKVDPVFFDGAYFLGPDKGGERAYALLATALRRSGLCALARWASRGKGHLVLIRPAASFGLVMQVLHFAGEVRSIDDVVGEAVGEKVPEAELKLALQLIRKIAAPEFRPEGHTDQVRERIEAAIARKVKGEAITVSSAEGTPAPTMDLTAALKASLAGKKPPKAARGRRAA
jgi:DNA end-binding protein Ku